MANTCDHVQRLSNLFGCGGSISMRDGFFNSKTAVLTKPDGSCISGLATISKYLSRNSPSNQSFYSNVPEKAAQIDQWLEYVVTHLDRCLQEKDLHQALQDLDRYLSNRVYFVGASISVADVLVYYSLYNTMNDLTFYEKEKYINVSRWFKNIQNDGRVSEGLKNVFFQRNLLYDNTSGHH